MPSSCIPVAWAQDISYQSELLDDFFTHVLRLALHLVQKKKI
jgi:hypothetical protein